MILDRIENRRVYSGVNEGVNKILEIAEGITPDTYPTERLYISQLKDRIQGCSQLVQFF